MPTKQSVMDNAPANWRITSNNGTVIVAVNIVTGEIFSGPHAEFNLKTQATPNSISTPADLVRHNDMHLGLGTPQTLWASGMLFWLPAGDGGANGMAFVGDGTGSFTLSAAVLAGFTIPQGLVYLTANAGGAGNSAGWYYFTMSDDTHGKVYTATYNSTSGIVPVFPASPVEMAFISATSLTSTTSEIQALQVAVNFASQLGINGTAELLFQIFGNTPASSKVVRTRAGTNFLHEYAFSTNPVVEGAVSITCAGKTSKQFCTRSNSFIGHYGTSTLNSNFRAVNLAAESSLNISLKATALTDHFAVIVRKITAIYGD